MEYWLTPEQSQLHEHGEPQESYRVEEDIFEVVDRLHITTAVVVRYDDGTFAFALTPSAGR